MASDYNFVYQSELNLNDFNELNPVDKSAGLEWVET